MQLKEQHGEANSVSSVMWSVVLKARSEYQLGLVQAQRI